MPTRIKKLVPRTLIIDNYDSYTRNILRLFYSLNQDGTTWDLEDIESRVVVVNIDSISKADLVKLLPSIDCLIFGPGPGSPHNVIDKGWVPDFIKEHASQIPILGICLGHQEIATSFGGKVCKSASPQHGQPSTIQVLDGSCIFKGIPQHFTAIQYNSLTVNPDALPSDLKVIATAANGDIMALKHQVFPLWGVQFHPESVCSTFGLNILENFLSFYLSKDTTASNLPTSITSLSTTRYFVLLKTKPESVKKYTVEVSKIPNFKEISIPEVCTRFRKRFDCSMGMIWLDSARPNGEAQFSHLAVPTKIHEYNVTTNTVKVYNSMRSEEFSLESEDFFEHISSLMQQVKESTGSEIDGFPIGMIGYLGYEMKAVSLPHGEKFQTPSNQKDSIFGFCNTLLSYDHQTREWFTVGLVSSSGSDEYGISTGAWQRWKEQVGKLFQESRRDESANKQQLPSLEPIIEEEDYIRSIKDSQELILAGESYELCLTTQFRAVLESDGAFSNGDIFSVYLDLRTRNPAPYGAYLHFPSSQLTILSSSPERFIKITPDASSRLNAEMKPIKGTIPRSQDADKDEEARRSLEKSEKDKAENLMIVDLVRNDLLGICDGASVVVDKLMVVETYQTVHQLVSSIKGRLMSHVTPAIALKAVFPPGSMTGAPKLRSVMLLEQLENRIPRGVYSGALGYFSIGGRSDFSVVIRTLVFDHQSNTISLGAGGAITRLSDAQGEWEEVLVKRNAVLGRTSN